MTTQFNSTATTINEKTLHPYLNSDSNVPVARKKNNVFSETLNKVKEKFAGVILQKKARKPIPTFTPPSPPQKLTIGEITNRLMGAIKADDSNELQTLLRKANEMDFNINSSIDESNNTLLHFAVAFDNPDILKILVDNGASLTIKNILKDTPLQYAQAQENFKAAEFLKNAEKKEKSLQSPTVNKLSDQPLNESKYQKQLTPTLRDSGMNSLLIAIFNNDSKEAINLISSNPNLVSKTTRERITALHLACQNNLYDVVEKLMESKASIDKKDSMERTPLHYAVISGAIDIVTLLAQKKADLNIQDEEGNTPLHLAAIMGRTDIAKQLLRAGANPKIINNAGNTPKDIDASLLKEINTPSIESIANIEASFNPYLYFAKKTNQTITSAAIFQTTYSSVAALANYTFSYDSVSYNPTLLLAVPSWVMVSTMIDTILRTHQQTAIIPYTKRRALGDVFAGIVVLSTMHFFGEVPTLLEIGKTVVGIYGTELFLKKAMPRIVDFSSRIFQYFFSKQNAPLLISESIKFKAL